MAPLLPDKLLPYTGPGHAIISPRTSEEWKAILEKVKVLYLERSYKRCVSRSTEILNGAKDPVSMLLS